MGGQRHDRGHLRRSPLAGCEYSYFNHWGNHAGAALRALHAFVANARLDVTTEVATA
ncbi:DUF5063 domain-containing protein [Actinomadura sp. BRA 177]|uniref:DUF5063 domain-containing protein n=1 Tax=Actinomadura sp. BRA 177 TaxID=2745202 RepID=UPI0020CBE092|nr:DUF5063 domain-containing protein [Actinomadura sp. BRA 177]